MPFRATRAYRDGSYYRLSVNAGNAQDSAQGAQRAAPVPFCPVPISYHAEIQLAHGGGGAMTQQLLDRLILPAFHNTALAARHDAATLALPPGTRAAFCTDSHVVSPLFFPGGDIGQLAVFGTANDLAMAGAKPLWLGAGLILEEGLAISTLERIIASMADAATKAGIEIVAGDTKVVERGRGDGIYITTSGVGCIRHSLVIEPRSVRPGDAILLSGDVGRHGMAILAQREGLAFDSPLSSDCALLWPAVTALLDAGIEIHCLRDLTRGGLATAAIEIAEGAGALVALDEGAIPVSAPVRGACEILGLDPLYVACEGRFIAFVPAAQAGAALEILARFEAGAPAQIGTVGTGAPGEVSLRSVIGIERTLDRLSGEQLPRIC
jgi:hydrogenase expression/formation protein HypE